MSVTDTLPLFASAAPSVSESEVQQLVTYLRGRGWVKRAVITREFGWNERKVRRIAEMAEGQILGTDEGYCLTLEASAEDMQAWNARYTAQIERMKQRRDRTWVVFTRGSSFAA